MLKIAICDDQPEDLDILANIVDHILQKSNQNVNVSRFSDGESLLKEIEEKTPDTFYQLYFLDIYMNQLMGIQIAERIRKIQPDAQFVFVTNSVEMAVDAFSLKALHYLVKPINEEQIREVFNRFDSFFLKPAIQIKDGRDMVKIYLDNILYIESERHTINIMTKNGHFPTGIPLSKLEEQLDKNFLRVSRSIIIHMQSIKKLEEDKFILVNGKVVELKKRDRGQIRSKYKNWLYNQVKDLSDGRRQS